MLNFSVKYLVEKKIWKNIIPHQKVYTDEKWAKIVVHTVPIRLFSADSAPNSSGLLIRILNRTRSDQFRTRSSSIYSVQD